MAGPLTIHRPQKAEPNGIILHCSQRVFRTNNIFNTTPPGFAAVHGGLHTTWPKAYHFTSHFLRYAKWHIINLRVWGKLCTCTRCLNIIHLQKKLFLLPLPVRFEINISAWWDFLVETTRNPRVPPVENLQKWSGYHLSTSPLPNWD